MIKSFLAGNLTDHASPEKLSTKAQRGNQGTPDASKFQFQQPPSGAGEGGVAGGSGRGLVGVAEVSRGNRGATLHSPGSRSGHQLISFPFCKKSSICLDIKSIIPIEIYFFCCVPDGDS